MNQQNEKSMLANEKKIKKSEKMGISKSINWEEKGTNRIPKTAFFAF
jgi:hypothetical protein